MPDKKIKFGIIGLGLMGREFAACVTPEETALSHSLFTAALRSQKNRST
jgi:hypothetical protein